MAKDGTISVHEVRAPGTVEAGNTFTTEEVIRVQSASVSESDSDRCSNTGYCDGDGGYCIRPYAVTPVDGTIVGDPVCVTPPSEGVKDVTVTYTLTAPDEFAPEPDYRFVFGVAPATGSGMPGGNDFFREDTPDFPAGVSVSTDEVSALVAITGRTGSGETTIPEVNVPTSEWVQGGVRAIMAVQGDESKVTGVSWVLMSNDLNGFDPDRFTAVMRSGGLDTSIPVSSSVSGRVDRIVGWVHTSSGESQAIDSRITGDRSLAQGEFPADRVTVGGGKVSGIGGGGVGGLDSRTLALLGAGGLGLVGLAAVSQR